MKGEVVRAGREQRTLLGSGPALYVNGHGREASPVPPPPPPAALAVAGEPRRESVVSAQFFQEGERQEALGWKDSPLVTNATLSDAPVEFSSFDRVPKRRGPLVMTTVVVATALLAGLGAEAFRGNSAHAWVAAHAGPQATHVWGRARSEWVTLKARGMALTGGKSASAATPASASVSTAAMATPRNVPPSLDAAPEAGTRDQAMAVSGVAVTDNVRVATAGSKGTNPGDRARTPPTATSRSSSTRRREPGSLRAGEPIARRPLSSWAQAELAMDQAVPPPPAPSPDFTPPPPSPPPSPAAEPGEAAVAGASADSIPATPSQDTAPPPFEAPAPEPSAVP